MIGLEFTSRLIWGRIEAANTYRYKGTRREKIRSDFLEYTEFTMRIHKFNQISKSQSIPRWYLSYCAIKNVMYYAHI